MARSNCIGVASGRNKGFVASFIIFTILANVMTSAIPVMTGRVFDDLLDGDATHDRPSDESRPGMDGN